MRGMVPFTAITITFTRPPDVSIRQWRDGMKASWRAVGELWQTKFLPQHFGRNAAARYGHQPRKSRYLMLKRLAGRGIGALAARFRRLGLSIKYGGEIDNVLTGEMERAVRLPARIIAFPTRATVRLIGPRYMTFRPYGSNHPDKGAEITKVIPEEREELTRLYASEVLSRFKSAAPQPLTVQI